MEFHAPWWLPGGQVQTIWPALFSRRHFGKPLAFQRQRWATPDGDFVDADFLLDQPPPSRHPGGDAALPPRDDVPMLVLFHGLEGSSQSHYAQAFADAARRRGWRFAIPHFRGCSGELNLAPRAYHSGDYAEIGWMLAQVRRQHRGPLIAAGVSLGGNALLRWAQEAGDTARQSASAVAAICSPIDLAASGRAIGSGFNRQVYTRMFLRTMVPKALRKLQQHPGLFNGQALREVRDLYEFDNLFTAPLHGFRNTEDYWARASAKPQLPRIRLPALVLNARNDPFVPAASLPAVQDAGPFVTLWQPAHGGHVGFPGGRFPGHVLAMPELVCHWLGQRLA
ncbi:YheT family hydrolase [Roseateles sp. DB2]|uniref:YheT family hydrolase n=1 Tax=Roseateles sp. DB2 TaxID=3453717 RepID=UPI003EEEA05E